MQRNNNLFNQLPNEVLFQILSYSDEKDIIKLSEVCFSFYNASKCAQMWRAKFEKAGCKPQLFQQVTNNMTDYAKLYACYIKIAPKKPATISEWMIYLIEDYLTTLQEFSLLFIGNEALYKNGIKAINDLFYKDTKEATGVPILDILAQLISVDNGQSQEVYKKFREKYNSYNESSDSLYRH